MTAMKGSEIRALARMLDRVDYYRLLKVERGAPSREIRSAYQTRRREFHPDRYRATDDETRDAVDRISKRLNESFSVLRHDARREAYDRGLEGDSVRYTAEAKEEVKDGTMAAAGRTPNGRKFFAMAGEEERRGDIEKAQANVKMAMTFEPGNAHFKAKLEELKERLPKPDSKTSYAIK
ncbi:MAG: DnaJ domain-containing protein [Deltaproteobacteria bacterium]|nr:DnaJ domain-containing protein [Deltaproteobacteria bacterium]